MHVYKDLLHILNFLKSVADFSANESIVYAFYLFVKHFFLEFDHFVIGAGREIRTPLCTAWKAGDTPCAYPHFILKFLPHDQQQDPSV